MDEILVDIDASMNDDMGPFKPTQSVGTLPPFAFTDESLVIDTEKGTAMFHPVAGKK
jgi:hypothetical protein